jgi:hypothetical protein
MRSEVRPARVTSTFAVSLADPVTLSSLPVIPFHYGLPYSEELHKSTNDINEFLGAVARRIGALGRGGFTDVDRAASFFLNHFRKGKLGRYTLDDLEQKADIYADPAFSFEADEAELASEDGTAIKSESREMIAQRKHLDILLPQPKAKHLALVKDLGLPRSFDPENPPWAEPYDDSLAHLNLTRYAPPIKTPTDVFEKVDEAVRRYYFGKEAKEGVLSQTQQRKIAMAERKAGIRAQSKAKLLERQRQLGLAQRPGIFRRIQA